MIASEQDSWNNCTYITQLTQTDWLIYRSLHECSATAQTFLKLLFEFILCLLSVPLREGRMLVLSSKYNIEQADFTDWIYFQSPSLIEEISPQHKYLKT